MMFQLGNIVDAEFLKMLRCPISGQRLLFEKNHSSSDSGFLISQDSKYSYPIRGGIPRFVDEENYASSFGMQWNYFSKTQLDSYSGQPISRNRFLRATGWKETDLRGKWVLDVGCGSGRFAEIALSLGAKVIALDYSSAVDSCYSNLINHPNLYAVQGDIYALPFEAKSFNYIYSLGVLQHTPDVSRALLSLPPLLVNEGQICVDVYWKRLRTMAHMKYLLRPFTKRMDKEELFYFLKIIVPAMLRVSQCFGAVPFFGRILKRLIPVADYTGIYNLSQNQLIEWAILDTFDMLSPRYDNPQTARTLRSLLKKSGIHGIEIFHEGMLVGRGKK